MLGLIMVAGLLWFVIPGCILGLAGLLRRKPRSALAETASTRSAAAP